MSNNPTLSNTQKASPSFLERLRLPLPIAITAATLLQGVVSPAYGAPSESLPVTERSSTSQKMSRVKDSDEMVTALRRGDSVVVQGFRDRGAELATLRSKIDEINLSKGSHWQMVLIEESATHTYQSGPQSAKSGAAAFLEELSERYTQSPAFNKQQRNGEQDGALAFVSLDRDGKNRMLMLWAHDYFDSRDAGEKSDAFKKEIFPRVTSIIRDKGQLGEGMLTLVQELEKAAALNQSHSERNQKIVLYVIGGVVVIGVGALLISTLCSSRRRGFGSSSNSSGGSFFYFGDGGGGGCGGSSCGGGGGCDGGGF